MRVVPAQSREDAPCVVGEAWCVEHHHDRHRLVTDSQQEVLLGVIGKAGVAFDGRGYPTQLIPLAGLLSPSVPVGLLGGDASVAEDPFEGLEVGVGGVFVGAVVYLLAREADKSSGADLV